MVENLVVALVVMAAVGVIGRKIWRMRCIRARKNDDENNKCGGCPGCGPG